MCTIAWHDRQYVAHNERFHIRDSTYYTLYLGGSHTLFCQAHSMCKGYSGDPLDILSNDKFKHTKLE
jgi:hypothetical protein